MKFLDYCDNSNIITEAYEMAEVKAVSEGWGYVFTGIASLIDGGLTHTLNFWMSAANLKKIMNNKQLRSYISKECNRLLKEEQRKDKSVTKNCPSGPIKALSRLWHGNDELPFFDSSRWMNFRSDIREDIVCDTIVDGFNITFFYDADHIDAAVVVFYSKDRDSFIGRRLAAPTNAEAAQMFRHE